MGGSKAAAGLSEMRAPSLKLAQNKGVVYRDARYSYYDIQNIIIANAAAAALHPAYSVDRKIPKKQNRKFWNNSTKLYFRFKLEILVVLLSQRNCMEREVEYMYL